MAKQLSQTFRAGPRHRIRYAVGGLLLPFFAWGCASPGPPRSPSLNQPEPIKTAEIHRIGTKVELSFRLPQRNTDHLPLKGGAVTVTLCRSVETGKCLPLPGTKSYPLQTTGQPTEVTLTDDLGVLAHGRPQVLAYRIDLKDVAGHTAGYSDPFFSVSGEGASAAPGISVDGSRLGVVISWNVLVRDGKMVIRREALDQRPVKAKSKLEPTLLVAPPDAKGTQLLDTSALVDTPYRYTAEVRREVVLGGRTFTVRSEPSAPVTYVLHDIYPPPAPTELSAAVFPLKRDDASAGAGVDLIWQPVQDAGLQGYIVYRTTAGGSRVRVTKEPVTTPAFHDELHGVTGSVVYSVSAIDAKGNESGVVSTSADVVAQ